MKKIDEAAQIRNIAQQHARQFSAVSAETIESTIRDIHAQFDGAPIPEFMPVLVARKEHSTLSELAYSDR